MIWNIIDRREKPYRWLKVNAVIESTCHDNSCEDSDQAPDDSGNVYAERAYISVHEAVIWANDHEASVTLYLYDAGKGL